MEPGQLESRPSFLWWWAHPLPGFSCFGIRIRARHQTASCYKKECCGAHRPAQSSRWRSTAAVTGCIGLLRSWVPAGRWLLILQSVPGAAAHLSSSWEHPPLAQGAGTCPSSAQRVAAARRPRSGPAPCPALCFSGNGTVVYEGRDPELWSALLWQTDVCAWIRCVSWAGRVISFTCIGPAFLLWGGCLLQM